MQQTSINLSARTAPAARRTDPITSHLAAASVVETGTAAAQREQVLAAVQRLPGSTARELADACDLDRYAVSRRLPEVERAGYIRRGEIRDCSAGGRPSITWYPGGKA